MSPVTRNNVCTQQFTLIALHAVSYTHLDVYKRQAVVQFLQQICISRAIFKRIACHHVHENSHFRLNTTTLGLC